MPLSVNFSVQELQNAYISVKPKTILHWQSDTNTLSRFQFNYFFFIILCAWVYTMCVQYPQRSEVGLRFLGTSEFLRVLKIKLLKVSSHRSYKKNLIKREALIWYVNCGFWCVAMPADFQATSTPVATVLEWFEVPSETPIVMRPWSARSKTWGDSLSRWEHAHSSWDPPAVLERRSLIN